MNDSVGTLRREVLRARRGSGGPGTRYPAALRSAITRHARQRLARGASVAAIGQELGVSAFTLSRWLQAGEPGSVRPVEVVAPEPSGRPLSGRLVVTTAGGVRVEGLDLPALFELLRVLG
jgi:transposase-like protein